MLSRSLIDHVGGKVPKKLRDKIREEVASMRDDARRSEDEEMIGKLDEVEVALSSGNTSGLIHALGRIGKSLKNFEEVMV